jgi:hypothetical protein
MDRLPRTTHLHKGGMAALYPECPKASPARSEHNF